MHPLRIAVACSPGEVREPDIHGSPLALLPLRAESSCFASEHLQALVTIEEIASALVTRSER